MNYKEMFKWLLWGAAAIKLLKTWDTVEMDVSHAANRADSIVNRFDDKFRE